MSIPQSSSRTSGRQPEIWGKVPQRNRNFTGREVLLLRLHAGVTSNVTAVVPHALHGIGGVGKTQLAIEYAHRFGAEYDLVWWIPADQPMLVRSSLAALAPHLGLPSPDVTGIVDAASAVLDALRRGEPYRNWLLIFDNADLPQDIKDVVPQGPGHVLITSRNPAWQDFYETVQVDVFTREESIEFLGKRVPRAAPEEADRLAEELGDLPLALEQAGALQAETGMSMREYLLLLRERTAQLLDANKSSYYPLSLTAAWALSVSQLSENLPEALELLRCCAFFGPEPIPRDVFGELSEEYAAGSRLAELLADPIRLSKVIRILGRYALARIDSESRTIQVHRLVQALLRDELGLEQQAALQHEVHLLLAAAAPGKPDETANWRSYVELLGHVTPAAIEVCQVPLIRNFALDVLRFLFSAGNFEPARDLSQRFLIRWREDSGDDDASVLSAQANLALALRELGKYHEAYDLNRATLTRMQAVLGQDDEETLWMINSHGADFRARGDFAGALRHDEDSLRRHEKKFGPNHRRTLLAIHNLAIDYLLLGDYDRALQLQQKSFAGHRRIGSIKTSILASWNGMARIVRLQGNYFEACDIGEDAYEFGVSEVSRDHPWTLRTAKDLSIAKRRAGLTDDAFDIAQQTYDREQRIFGQEHADTLAAALCLANALRTRGEVDQSLELLRRTAARYPDRYGADHPFRYGCDMNLALLLRVNDEAEAARALDQRCLDGFDQRLGRDHHFSLTCAINLASDHATLGEAGAARRLGEDTLMRLRHLLGADHPLTLAGASNLALDRRREGDAAEADALAADTFERYRRVLGEGHPDAQVALQGDRLDFDFDPPAI